MANIVERNLAKTCILVTVSLGRWQGRKLDVSASDEITKSKRAKSGALSVTKRLVSDHHCPSFKAIKTLDGKIRNNLLYRRTIATPIKNVRLVTASALGKLSPELEAAFEERTSLINQLCDVEFPAFLALAQDYLGDAFDDRELPTPGQVRASYRQSKEFRPLADACPSLIGFPEEVAEAIALEASKSHDHLREIAQGSLAPRLYDALVEFSEAMDRFAVVKEQGPNNKTIERRLNPFRDSKVDNVWKAAEDCIDLDLSVDRNLAAFAQSVFDAFKPVDAEGLRTFKHKREETGEASKDFQRQMQDMGLIDIDASTKRARKLADVTAVDTPEIDAMTEGMLALDF